VADTSPHPDRQELEKYNQGCISIEEVNTFTDTLGRQDLFRNLSGAETALRELPNP
jgi:hypothetical protein